MTVVNLSGSQLCFVRCGGRNALRDCTVCSGHICGGAVFQCNCDQINNREVSPGIDLRNNLLGHNDEYAAEGAGPQPKCLLHRCVRRRFDSNYSVLF